MSVSLTAEERALLRQAVDAAKREREAVVAPPRHKPSPTSAAVKEPGKHGAVVHGTEYGYSLGCSCDECKRAAATSRAARRGKSEPKTHNNSGYSSGCRCDICREAHRIYVRDLKARKRDAA